MKIICDYHGKKIDGICFQFGPIYFPFRDWEDFCVPIVSDWIDVVNNSCCNSTFNLFFMDGPYYLLCHRKNNLVLISAVDDHNGSIILNDIIPFLLLQTQLIETARMLLESENKSSDTEFDFITLENGLKKLEKNVAQGKGTTT